VSNSNPSRRLANTVEISHNQILTFLNEIIKHYPLKELIQSVLFSLILMESECPILSMCNQFIVVTLLEYVQLLLNWQATQQGIENGKELGVCVECNCLVQVYVLIIQVIKIRKHIETNKLS